MELKTLHLFVSVVDAGSFSRAATRLNMAQSALSRQIALLEGELSTRLLERNGRGIRLTESGATLLLSARNLIELADRARSEIVDMNRSPSGRIRVGLPPRVGSFLAPTLVKEFRKLFPNALITLFEGMSHHLREQLVAGELEIALMFDPLPNPRLIYETIWVERMVFVGAESMKKFPSVIPLASLAQYPLVLASRPHTMRLVLDHAVHQEKITLNVIAEVDSLRGVFALASQGVACSVVPEMAVAQESSRFKLRTAEIDSPNFHSNLVLAVPESGSSTRLIKGTLELLRRLDFKKLATAGQN